MAQERDSPQPQPSEQVALLYEQAEARAAEAGEHLVGSKGFASVLGQLAENAAAVTKLGSDAMDLVIRNLRVAGRRDVVRLARQLARTEDKLERVLQELEEVRDELGRRKRDRSSSARGGARAAGTSSRASSGQSNGSGSRRSRSTKRSGAKQQESSSS